ncbi:unnamed protein product [Prunus armeniaca]
MKKNKFMMRKRQAVTPCNRLEKCQSAQSAMDVEVLCMDQLRKSSELETPLLKLQLYDHGGSNHSAKVLPANGCTGERGTGRSAKKPDKGGIQTWEGLRNTEKAIFHALSTWGNGLLSSEQGVYIAESVAANNIKEAERRFWMPWTMEVLIILQK